MRGNLWQVMVVGVFLALMLPALNLAYDSGTAGQTTLDIVALLEPFGNFVGIFFFVICAGAFITWFSGGDF